MTRKKRRFPEAVKVKVKRLASMRCCNPKCHDVDIDIHHIVPASEGGASTEENAAPLCAGCHRSYGGDPTKQKMIRGWRDYWYEQVAGIAPGAVVRASPYQSFDDCHYSFVRREFIHPLIVQDLLGSNYLSEGPSVVAIDLATANDSDRYFGEFTADEDEDGRFAVHWHDEDENPRGGESFSYSHIATSPSGIEMVQCWDRGGGSSTFCYIGLFYFEVDRAIDEHSQPVKNARNVLTLERPVIRSLGSICLGDRYKGEITYHNGVLAIGPDVGWFELGEEAAKAVAVP